MMALNTKCRDHGSDHPDILCPYIPKPCRCQWVSTCCGAPLSEMDSTLTCSRCHDHTTFEPTDEDTWKFMGTTLYGDDADGNRGVPLRAWQCTECDEEVEVIG